MVWAVALSFLLVLAVVYVPFLAPFFDTVPLTADDWLLMLPFFFASPVAMELLKVYFMRPEGENRGGSTQGCSVGRIHCRRVCRQAAPASQRNAEGRRC